MGHFAVVWGEVIPAYSILVAGNVLLSVDHRAIVWFEIVGCPIFLIETGDHMPIAGESDNYC